MVVSAILLATMAPITGALFGASYGTAIRIGYEIIFPALFGDMINDKKNVGQEEGAKRTIKALHTMFTATGGASALEFGIEQGIEMAKKKTESPDVQYMIDLSLGLTPDQITRGSQRFGSTTVVDQERAQKFIEQEQSKQVPGFATPPADSDEIQNMRKNYPNTIDGNRKLCKLMNVTGFGNRNVKQKKALIFLFAERKKENPDLCKTKTAQQFIQDLPAGIVKQIAQMYDILVFRMQTIRKLKKNKKQKAAYLRNLKAFLNEAKKYNQFVAKNGKSNLQIDTAASIKAGHLIPK